MLAPDIASLNMIDILQKGETSYRLVTTVKDVVADAKFQVGENNNFKINFILQPEAQEKGIDIDYFCQKPFALVTEGMAIHLSNSKVVSGSCGLATDTPCNFEIEVSSFKGDVDDRLWKQSKQRVYIKYNKKNFNPYSSGLSFDLKTHPEDNGFFNAVSLKIGKKEILFYHESVDADYGYFIICHNQLIDFEQLEKIVNAIITGYGFLNGFYMLDTIYYFTMKEIDGQRKASFYYENFQSSILSKKPILDSGNYFDIPKNERKLTGNQFERLINLLYHDTSYLRSAYLLIEAGALNGCSQASLGAVALETISKKMQENADAENIIEDKKIWRSVKYELNKVLKRYSTDLTKEQMKALMNKLNYINNKPNSNKLTAGFEQLGIVLTHEEKECINSRNLFLHGSIPRNKDTSLTDQELLNILANRLVMLSSMLLLKLSGFEGYVIDRGMTEVVKWRMIHQGQKVPGGNFLRNIVDPKL
jgi:hypothetical protein